MRPCVHAILASVTLVATIGCLPQARFGSNSFYPPELESCNSAANQALINKESTADGKKRVRNDIAKQAEVHVVLSQQSYMGNIDSHRNLSFSTIEIANLGLTAAAGAVGGPAAAKAFALAATAVIGIKSTAVTYFNPTANGSDLSARMEQSFAKNQLLLEQKLNTSYSNYGLGDACADVEWLRDSGQKRPAGAGIVSGPTDPAPATPAPATQP